MNQKSKNSSSFDLWPCLELKMIVHLHVQIPWCWRPASLILMPQSPLIKGEECQHISWRRNSPKLQCEHCDFVISRREEFFILHIMYHFTSSQEFCNRFSISSPLFLFDVTCPHFHRLQIPFLGERTLPPDWKDKTKKKSTEVLKPRKKKFTSWVLMSERNAPSPSRWQPANNMKKIPVWIKPSTSRSLIVVLRTHLNIKKITVAQKLHWFPSC